MRNVCAVLLAAGAMVCAEQANAQQMTPQAGTVELGVFGQLSRMDQAWAFKVGGGGGARVGVYLSPRWFVEGDFALSTLGARAPRAPGSYQYTTFDGRLLYDMPWRGNDVLLGVGAGGERIDGVTDFVLSPDLGYRWNVNDRVALRFDLLMHYVENVADPLFNFPPLNQVNRGAARSTNVDFRVGLSFMFGRKHEAPIPPPPPRVEPAAPPPVVRPTPAPPPVTRVAPPVNQDSIDAANRSRLHAMLEQPVYFDYDKSELRGDARTALDAKLPALRANPSVRIRIEGNTDERGSDAYNMALGQQRASRAKAYLVANGIDAGRIDIVSFGEERPACTGHDETCWQQNRRDQFVIVVGG